MLAADIKGKLSLREERSEDFLTSSVFSAFRYVGGRWLERFLRKAHRWEDTTRQRLNIRLESPRYLFWPNYHDPVNLGRRIEPDVVILSKRAVVVVEAKNYAGKHGKGVVAEDSGEGGVHVDRKRLLDQLAREYFVGRDLASRGSGCSDFYVVYVTRHAVFPAEDIAETLSAIAEMDGREGQRAPGRIYWVNWQQAYETFKEMADDPSAPRFQEQISRDMLEFLANRSLCPFEGFEFLDAFKGFAAQAERWSGAFYARSKRPYWTLIDEAGIDATDARLPFYGRGDYWAAIREGADLSADAAGFYHERGNTCQPTRVE